MQRIAPAAMDREQGPSRGRIAGIAAVTLIHAVFLYAFITGMAQHAIKAVPHLLEVTFPPRTEQVKPKPLPPMDLPKVDLAPLPQVAPPVIRIAQPPRHHKVASPITVAQGTSSPARMTQPAAPLPAPLPEVKPMVAPTAASAIAGTHTMPPYPDIARRLGYEGTVRLSIVLDERGAVSDVAVVKSSGHDRLDDAARDWIKGHWRYRPATRNGAPVAAQVLADIVFDIRK